MIVKTEGLRTLLVALAVAMATACHTIDKLPASDSRRDEQIAACVANFVQEVRVPLAGAPNFSTFRESTAWVARRLPGYLHKRLSQAGVAVSTATKGKAFGDMQALSAALLGSTLDQLQNVPGCVMDEPYSAVPREALLDQLGIGLSLDKNLIFGRLRALGVEDPHYAKQIIFYGIVLDLGGIPWTEEQLATLVRQMT